MNHESAQQQFREEGYLIYPGVFGGRELQRLLDACNRALKKHTEAWDRGHPNEDFECMRHLNDSRWHRDGLEDFKTIMEAIADPRCLGPIERIFGGPSLFRSTSYFANPRFKSRDGNWHRDSQFICASEAEEKAMLEHVRRQPAAEFGLQFQVPLIDSDDVEFVPYSATRDDSPDEHYIRLADKCRHSCEGGMPHAMRMALKAGDGVIFNPFGLHRGRYHVDKPRRTLMLTYTPLHAPRRDFFSNQPWFEEPGHLDGLSTRAKAYFGEFIDIYRPFWASENAAKTA